jgi:mono/diheme cytochrome c family protein
MIKHSFLVVASSLLLSLPVGAAFADGAASYAANCASCHGAAGDGDTPAGKAMKVQPFGAQSADQVVAKVKASDRHKAIVGKLSDADLAAVAAHVATLK